MQIGFVHGLEADAYITSYSSLAASFSVEAFNALAKCAKNICHDYNVLGLL